MKFSLYLEKQKITCPFEHTYVLVKVQDKFYELLPEAKLLYMLTSDREEYDV